MDSYRKRQLPLAPNCTSKNFTKVLSKKHSTKTFQLITVTKAEKVLKVRSAHLLIQVSFR